jgi:OmpA-OmpF porin, OOP family
MRKLAIAAAFASTILATPAVARDGAMYVGIEGGAMIVEDMKFDYGDPTVFVDEGIIVDHKIGYDIDLIGGYDLGMFRVELEAAHKRASVDQVRFAPATDIITGGATGIDADGRVGVTSAMANALLDFGDDDGWRGYVGGGAGLARVKHRAFAGNVGFSDSDTVWAWQGIAGFSKAITPNLDLGLKYRYFNTQKLDFGNDDAIVPYTLHNSRFQSHSLLASLVYNLWTPAPPPPVVVAPPPPPPPATQTCPDGSVILATDVCPAPPPPPPPPPPTEERG